MWTRRGMLAVAACAAVPGRAQPVLEPTSMDILNRPHRTHILGHSDVSLKDGSAYRLFRAVPKGQAPQGGWPSLWLLDGNAAFDRLNPDLLIQHPRLAVIGIGYPTDLPFDTTRRARDYTPPPLRRDPKRPERWIGGADIFLARLTGALRRHVESDIPLDPVARMLAGHSYGGLCTIQAMSLPEPRFTRFAAISPALWLTPQADIPGNGSLTVIVGDRERERGILTDPDRPAHRVPTEARRFVADARARGQDVTLHVLRGMQHGETLAGAHPLLMQLADTAAGDSPDDV